MDHHRAANRDNWDDRVAIHWDSTEYDAGGFIADPTRLSDVVAFDRDYLGDVNGKRLVHLQCHIGKDTLSWARLGAEVTGVDFSEAGIAAARRLSAESGTPGRFVLSEVYDAPAVLGERFDIVYTGVGALNWLPDITGWARVVAALLEPGGTLYLREGHPMLWGLEWREDGGDALVVRFPYFETVDPVSWDEDSTYAGDGKVAHTRTYEWNHGIAEIITALMDAGLTLTALREHRSLEWQGQPHMERGDDGLWRLPEHQRDLVPLMYSLTAVAPS
ncbi:MAG: class I SAM-dependent methyltransferase [Deltaproteobacteria bacterium]|nr:class I SAM-dependent methyltransferase [Deltaproteobacteria bacterium]